MTYLWDSSDNDWSFIKLEKTLEQIEIIARDELKIDWFPLQVEIISSEQMIDAYVSHAMPVMYNHWSFGKRFSKIYESYKRGQMGLAYEVIINSKPSIAYLMEENTMAMQTLVLAHCIGHSSFFKNNHVFKKWTDPEGIIDYLVFAKNYITECEEKYGESAVEEILDSCHALQHQGIDKYKKPKKLSREKEKDRQKERNDYLQSRIDDLWKTLPPKSEKELEEKKKRFLDEPQENLLYFIEKNSPTLKPWQREIVRIVRKLAQYFYPQMQCLTGNHLVSTKNGLIRLDELIQNVGYHKVDGLDLLTINDKFTEVSHLYKKKAKIIKITTESGKIFRGTQEHPLMVLDKTKHSLKKIGEMTINDYIVNQLAYDNIFSKNYVKLKSLPENSKLTCKICNMESNSLASHIVQIHNMSIKEYKRLYNEPVTSLFHKRSKSVNKITKSPNICSEEFSEFLGFLVGTVKNKKNSKFTFKSNKPELTARFAFLVNTLFGLNITPFVDNFYLNSVEFMSYTLKEFLLLNCPEILKNEKVIPKLICQSPKSVVCMFVRGLFDSLSSRKLTLNKTCGNASISGYDYDEEFFQTLHTLLISLGIVPYISKSNRLTVEGIYELFNLEEVQQTVDVFVFKILHDYKSQFSKIIGSNIEFINYDKENSYFDIIPGAKKLLDDVRIKLIELRSDHAKRYNLSKLSYKYKVENNLLVNQNFVTSEEIPELKSKEIRKSDMIKEKQKFEKLHTLINVIPECNDLVNLLSVSKDVYYDKIVSIEEDGEDIVYDVTIPENHLFWVDGVISHNTKVANEGFATFTHYYIINRLWDKGLIHEGTMLEMLRSHTGVVNQLPWEHKGYSGLNPYYLGFNIFRDIKRICEEPTEEDRLWFPELVNTNWVEAIKTAVQDFKDESFILQYLSPKVIRDMKLFVVADKARSWHYDVANIHDDYGYKKIRKALSEQHNMNNLLPDIQVVDFDIDGDRTLYLQHNMINGTALADNVEEMLKHVYRLWGFDILLESLDAVTKEVKETHGIIAKEQKRNG